MNLITVIPITRQKTPPELHYFTASDAPTGAVVSVPLRSKNIHAIVAAVKSVADVKAEIRSAPFEIRKLGRVRASAFFHPSFMAACRTLADYYATGVGAAIKSLVPEAVLENAGRLSPPLPVQTSFLPGPAAGVSGQDEICAVQGDDADRLSSWRSLIRQEFARKRSVVFHAPTLEEARRLYASLEKGIEGYIFLFHSGMTGKNIVETWNKASDVEHPVVMVAAGAFVAMPRGDVGSVVIERHNGRGWISRRTPYVDARRAVEVVAALAGKAVYLSDVMLDAETLRRKESGEILDGSPFKWRSVSRATDLLVDMKRPAGARDGEKSGGFRALSPELKNLIEKNRRDGTHVFILAFRRGMSPVTVCDDCETVVSCSQCSAPVVLHAPGGSGGNFFMCHVCGERRSADEQCSNCGGWRLSPLGVGIELAEKEIRESFPGLPLFKIDADSAASEAKMNDAMARFRAKPGSVLLGTEAALARLDDKVDHAAVVSLDSLFALPDFRTSERIMYALIRLRSMAERTLTVQTRKAEESVFEYALKGNISDFYRSVLDERKKFGYPPFETLIKLTVEGGKEDIAREMAGLQTLMAPRETVVFPAFTAVKRGRSVIHGLIKVPRREWPDAELVGKIRSLPPSVTVKVDPESLL